MDSCFVGARAEGEHRSSEWIQCSENEKYRILQLCSKELPCAGVVAINGAAWCKDGTQAAQSMSAYRVRHHFNNQLETQL